MEALSPSVVVTSVPSGGGMIDPLIMMIPMFTNPPITMPAVRATIFLTIGLVVYFYFEAV
ncbi:MAG: hypothetical protein IPL08_00320 [Saprospiraceae bacterium]|nr:hypothetical protein [Saprospiraceae bacterium]